jgi:hypothetical protein
MRAGARAGERPARWWQSQESVHPTVHLSRDRHKRAGERVVGHRRRPVSRHTFSIQGAGAARRAKERRRRPWHDRRTSSMSTLQALNPCHRITTVLSTKHLFGQSRTHLSLNKDAPIPRSIAAPDNGRVVTIRGRRTSSPVRTAGGLTPTAQPHPESRQESPIATVDDRLRFLRIEATARCSAPARCAPFNPVANSGDRPTNSTRSSFWQAQATPWDHSYPVSQLVGSSSSSVYRQTSSR